MSKNIEQINIHKKRLKKITGLNLEDFMKVTDEKIKELQQSLSLDDFLEIDHLLYRMIELERMSLEPETIHLMARNLSDWY